MTLKHANSSMLTFPQNQDNAANAVQKQRVCTSVHHVRMSLNIDIYDIFLFFLIFLRDLP